MLGVERIAGTVVWCCFVGISWFQAQFVHPIAEWWLESVLGTWEESLKSLIREVFAQVIRIADSILNALFTWFPGYQSAKTTFQKPSAWQSWWDENRQSTFNAIIDRAENPQEGLQPDVKPSNGVSSLLTQQAVSCAQIHTKPCSDIPDSTPTQT